MLTAKGEYTVTVEDVKLNLYVYKSNFTNQALVNLSKHTHTYTELFVCTKGSISIATEYGIIELSEGDIVIIPAGIAHHKYANAENAEWKTAAFSIQQYYTKDNSELWRKLIKICERRQPSIFRNVPELCTDIIKIYDYNTDTHNIIPALRLVLILTELAEQKQLDTLEYSVTNNPNQEIGRTVFLELYLEQNYMNDINVQELANMLHVSERQISRIIRQQYGTTLHKVLVTKRMNAAGHFLKTTTNSVEEICYRIGYKKMSSFYLQFHEYFKMTPAEYRKLFQK